VESEIFVESEMSDRAERYLHAARETARWLIGAAIETPDGLGWAAVPGVPETLDATLYGAGAGIALFLSDLASATEDAELAVAARNAALFVSRTPDHGRFGLYTGYAGMVLATHHAATVLGDVGLRSRGAAMLDHLVDAAWPAGGGIEWPAWPGGRGPWHELYHGAAGIALVAAHLGRTEVAVAAGADWWNWAWLPRPGGGGVRARTTISRRPTLPMARPGSPRVWAPRCYEPIGSSPDRAPGRGCRAGPFLTDGSSGGLLGYGRADGP